jgi:ABC-type branched-subunit amino acid transport system substrate-binding protein
MSVARAVTPIRVGVLMDFLLPPPSHWDALRDIVDTMELTFRDAQAARMLDRPVEVVVRQCDGLPRGTVKASIDAYGELVDEGCLAVFGPMVSDSAIPLREAVEREFQVPCLGWVGSDDWLGEWTFALSNGSLTDEPHVVANIVRQAGHRDVGVLVERSLVGAQMHEFFRSACEVEGLSIAGESSIAQTTQTIDDEVAALAETRCDPRVHLGAGLGMLQANAAFAAIGWDPPRYTGAAFENGYMSDDVMRCFLGWVGLEQYDETNPVGQAFLDHFERTFGRRPEYYVPMCMRDISRALAAALATARPLSPRGVLEALERVKMMPAASGAPGTRVSFGKWTRRGWMGSGYLVARSVEPDLRTTVLRGHFD